MGTSKRYADSVEAQMNRRVIEQMMRDHEPLSLTNDELELATEPLRRTPVPRPVRAWVRYGKAAVKVDGEAGAWTSRTVAVRWTAPDGREQRAWLWSSAVEGDSAMPTTQRRQRRAGAAVRGVFAPGRRR